MQKTPSSLSITYVQLDPQEKLPQLVGGGRVAGGWREGMLRLAGGQAGGRSACPLTLLTWWPFLYQGWTTPVFLPGLDHPWGQLLPCCVRQV